MKKNILILMFDGLPLYRLKTCPIKLPTYSSLIERGVYFPNVVATAPSTAMSLTSMFTGLFVHQLGRRSYSSSDSELPYETVSLFNTFKSMGYNSYVLWDEEMETGNPIKYKINTWSDSDTKFFHFRKKNSNMLHRIKNKIFDMNGGDWMLSELDFFMNQKFIEPWAAFVRFGPEVSTTYNKKCNNITNYLPDNELFQFDSMLKNFFKEDRSNTRVILCEDHGKMSGENGIFGYAFNLCEGTLHTPVLVVDEDDNPCVIDNLLSLRNFPEIVLGKELSTNEYLYADSGYADQWHRKTMVRKDHWKYIYHRDGWPCKEQLFDLRSDPFELINLADNFYVDPYRDSRPKGDTTSKNNSPSGLSLNGKHISDVLPRSDWNEISKVLDELRAERSRIWKSQNVADE